MGVFSILISRLSNIAVVVVIVAFVVLRPLFPFPSCAIRCLFSARCPTCGITTALRHAFNGEIALALRFHIGVIPILLILLRSIVLQLPNCRSVRQMLESRLCEVTLLGWWIVSGLLRGIVGFSNSQWH